MQLPWQARASQFHPYLAKSVAALPDGLRSAAQAAQAALPPGAKSVSICVIPEDYRAAGLLGSRTVPEQALIFTGDGILHVQAGAAGAPAPAYLRYHDILYIRSSLLLNYGRLEVVGAAQGRVIAQDLEFNAIGWRLIDPALNDLINKVLDLRPLPADEVGDWQEETTEQVRDLPLKFANGLRSYGMQPGDELLDAVFQEAVWTRLGAVWPQQLVPRRLLALTGASVVLIEEEQSYIRKSNQYGWIITQIPRAALRGMNAVAAQEGLQELVVRLERSGVTADLRVLLAAPTVGEWLRLWQAHAAERQPALP